MRVQVYNTTDRVQQTHRRNNVRKHPITTNSVRSLGGSGQVTDLDLEYSKKEKNERSSKMNLPRWYLDEIVDFCQEPGLTPLDLITRLVQLRSLEPDEQNPASLHEITFLEVSIETIFQEAAWDFDVDYFLGIIEQPIVTTWENFNPEETDSD